jgi:hypothetical protein
MMAPEHDPEPPDEESPEGEAGRNPFGSRIVFRSEACPLEKRIQKVKPRHPSEKQEKHDVSTDHLGLLRPRESGPEGHSQRRLGDVDAQNAEQSDQQGPSDIEEPEGEGDLLGGQEGKADEGRVDVDLQLVEAREKPDLGEIRPRQDQRRDRGDRRVVEAQTVEQVQANRNQQAGDQVAVGEEPPQPVIV